MPLSSQRMPKSRRELRERASAPAAPVVHPPPLSSIHGSVHENCLHFPYDCNSYRLPAYWCSACRVRAASTCSQMGLADVSGLFAHPITPCYPAGCASYPQVVTAPRPMACEVYAPCGVAVSACAPVVRLPIYGGVCATAPIARHDACPTSCISEAGAL